MMDLLSVLWFVLIKPFVYIYEYYKRQIFVNNGAHKIKLEEFIQWFENQLLTKSSVDISHANNLVRELDLLVVRLKDAACSSRSTVSVTTPQTNRLLRVCDQIDTLCAEYNYLKQYSGQHSHAIYPFESMLPDAEYLRDLIMKTKNKMKIIDDVTQSKKGNGDNTQRATKTGGRISEQPSKKAFDMPSAIKIELTRLAELMSALEQESISKSLMMKYFGELKQHIHKPYHHLVSTTAELPSTQDASAMLAADLEAHSACCESYDTARSAEVLQRAVLLRDELHEMERLVADTLSPLRKAVMGPQSVELHNALRTAHGIASLHIDAGTLGERLIKLMKRTNADLIRATSDEYGLPSAGSDGLVSLVDRAQRLLRGDIRRVEGSTRVSLCNDYIALCRFSSQALNEGVVEAVLQFDTPLFEAHSRDWGERFMLISECPPRLSYVFIQS
jgi:hypothetical protein